MLEELRKQSLQEEESVMHPYIPYVLFHTGDGFCLEHLNHNGMNVGAMKQHLRGKAHNVDPETGNPLNKIGLLKIIKELKNQEDKKSKREIFDDNFHKVTKIFERKDRLDAMTIANNELEGHRLVNVKNYLIIKYNEENPSKPRIPMLLN